MLMCQFQMCLVVEDMALAHRSRDDGKQVKKPVRSVLTPRVAPYALQAHHIPQVRCPLQPRPPPSIGPKANSHSTVLNIKGGLRGVMILLSDDQKSHGLQFARRDRAPLDG